jgi:hypothetical protein
MGSVADEPTATLPKLRLVVLRDSFGCDVVPVPLRLTVLVALVVELLRMVRVPVTAPAAVGANLAVSFTAAVGFRVSGSVAPEIVKPVPDRDAAVIVTALVPVDVRVRICVAEEPTTTLPKLRLAELSDSCGLDDVPVPLRLTVLVAPEAELLCIVKTPVTAPATVGANFTVSFTAVDGFRVSGSDAPVMVKPAPDIDAAVIFTALVPVDFKVKVCVAEEPTATLPKLRLVALSERRAVVPVPLRLTVLVVPEVELLRIVKTPVTAPAAVGANFTVSFTAVDGFRVSGSDAPVMVKPAPDIDAAVIVTALVPVELKIKVCVAEEPTATLPKFRLVALNVSTAVAEASDEPRVGNGSAPKCMLVRSDGPDMFCTPVRSGATASSTSLPAFGEPESAGTETCCTRDSRCLSASSHKPAG